MTARGCDTQILTQWAMNSPLCPVQQGWAWEPQTAQAVLLPASAPAGETVQPPAGTFSASLGSPCGTGSSRSHPLP